VANLSAVGTLSQRGTERFGSKLRPSW
jgi:hypothetical protein